MVDLNLRRRGSVYWDEEGEVRRALWFKVEGAGLEDGMKLIPCDETFAAGLEVGGASVPVAPELGGRWRELGGSWRKQGESWGELGGSWVVMR